MSKEQLDAPRKKILVVDFGGQYAHLIARRVREASVYSELVPWTITAEEISKRQPAGIILSGGPSSVRSPGAPKLDPNILSGKTPILGICYGAQLIVDQMGGKVLPTSSSEFGSTMLHFTAKSALFNGEEQQTVWMSHSDSVELLPPEFIGTAKTNKLPFAAFQNKAGSIFGLQFHPEVGHTEDGQQMLERFLYTVCSCPPKWTASSIIDRQIEDIRKRVKGDQVICGLSGGVDSAVAAALVHKAIRDQLTCVFVDTGLLRKGDAEHVENALRDSSDARIVHVDARERFFEKLRRVIEPEKKRKVIGETFIRVFEKEALELGAKFLVQGTLFSDFIESGTKDAANIKSHHNVGGLPEDMTFKLIEPLRELFKDEVRAVGSELGLPDEILWRQPFPGPGFGVRILGEVTPKRVEVLREADAIVNEEIRLAGLYEELWQCFAILLPTVKTVGVMGDSRTYAHPVVIRAITSMDAMTADWARLPYELIARISNRIVNEVSGVNRVALDVTSKPPATIEWE